ncbi:YqaE/Pmp3 family membrane protein [Neobacillus drentensis]|uniref:YqaE/Pmp3 family membrane protein n=1 Tax=Neobacillus drentensis TaxID=220684 RepID=UPI001F21D800|nr:YqaE/Pmp3 family membrane protein [Neobacillus drentensis]ULT56753.1 YqaE/Pmp3 family membrane protein [Neobacillus drentensis]
MLYLFAIIFPPVAILIKGKPFQALFNVLLTLCFWAPGVVHAWIVINGANKDARMKKQAQLIAEAQSKRL